MNRALIWALAFLLFLPALGAAGEVSETGRAILRQYQEIKKRQFPNVADISPQRALELAKQGKAIFLDVRSGEERAVSMLPGALSPRQFDPTKPLPAGKVLIVYCTTGYRSAFASNRLGQMRVKAFNLAGGVLAWVHHGGAMAGPDGKPSKRVHTYGPQPDSILPPGYKAVW